MDWNPVLGEVGYSRQTESFLVRFAFWYKIYDEFWNNPEHGLNFFIKI